MLLCTVKDTWHFWEVMIKVGDGISLIINWCTTMHKLVLIREWITHRSIRYVDFMRLALENSFLISLYFFEASVAIVEMHVFFFFVKWAGGIWNRWNFFFWKCAFSFFWVGRGDWNWWNLFSKKINNMVLSCKFLWCVQCGSDFFCCNY